MKKVLALLAALTMLLASATAERGTPEIVNTDEPAARTALIRCAGDFVIHDNLLASAKKAGGGSYYDFSDMLSEVAEYLGEADFTFTNVDGVLGTSEFAKQHGYHGYPSFSTPRSLIYDLQDIGIDLLTLANNHALDYWYSGLISTVTSMKEAGMPSVGGYRSLEEKQTPVIIEINGIRFGFLNYTDNLNKMDQRKGLDKEALEFGVDFWERANLSADVKRLKDAGAEVIVCYMHWGTEYRTTPGKSQINDAKTLANAGVDVIIGGGPHKVQLAEYIDTEDEEGKPKQVLCLYSLGNFLSDQRQTDTDCGIIFDFTVTKDENGKITIGNPIYRTTWVWRRQSGSTFQYKIVFSDEGAPKPSGMSDKDYAALQSTAQSTISRMSEGVGALYGSEEEEAIVSTPQRSR